MQIDPLHLQQLRSFCNQIHPLAEVMWADIEKVWQPVEFKRKMLLTSTGETEKYLYFVTAGIQRAFYMKESGKEATIVFTYPFSFSGVADSFLLQQPSKYYFETLTQSCFLRTTYQQIESLMTEHRPFELLIRKATSYALAGALERQIELQCFSAEEKFVTLMSRSAHLLNMIPHKYLASYLGIDAATFSKLLSTVKIGSK